MPKIESMKYMLLFAACLVWSNGFSQTCTNYIPPAVPGNIYHVFSDASINDPNGGLYYVCSGVHLTVNGSAGSDYYLEQGAQLTLNDHDGDNVFAKGNCTILDNTIEGIHVTMEATSTFSKPLAPGSAVVDICSSMIYDYSYLGGSSTCPASGINYREVQLPVAFPNPVQAGGLLSFHAELQELVLTDLTGKQLFITNQFPVYIPGYFSEGIYIMKFTDTGGNAGMFKLVIEK